MPAVLEIGTDRTVGRQSAPPEDRQLADVMMTAQSVGRPVGLEVMPLPFSRGRMQTVFIGVDQVRAGAFVEGPDNLEQRSGRQPVILAQHSDPVTLEPCQ